MRSVVVGTARRAVLAALLAAAALQAAAALGEQAHAPNPAPKLAVASRELAPGIPFAVLLSGDAGGKAAAAVLVGADGKALVRAPFFPLGADPDGLQVRAALLAVPATAVPGGGEARAVDAKGGVLAAAPLLIGGRDFVFERIPLDDGNSRLRTAEDPKKTAEAVELWKLLGRTDPDALFSFDPLRAPVDSVRRTSTFGDRRVYAYADGEEGTSVHAGIDFGVPTGTPVCAAARGKVVFARPRIVTGNSIVVEHLPGVYSLYYHLSRIDAAEGSVVEAGQQIGLSGSTGLSTGPHLHWELRVSGTAADPDAMTARPLIDKRAEMGTMAGSRSSAQDGGAASIKARTEGR